MINNFIIKAVPEINQLKVILDGFFMKSEIELAIHLIKRESSKLKRGYEVLLDITKFQSKDRKAILSYSRIQQLLKLMGCGELRFVGTKYAYAENEPFDVGLYPYENGWFF